MSDGIIQVQQFREIDLNDPFFNSLKNSYKNFPEWFKRKADEYAYVSFNSFGKLQAFLYLKIEKGPIRDVNPPINAIACIKIGTFKIVAHGTRLGERFVKFITNTALKMNLRIAYVTIFPEHEPLIRILEKYGFKKVGIKLSHDGAEDVYLKDMTCLSGDRQKDYPVVDARTHKKWIMGIYPKYHSNLFPDSILKTEHPSILEDVSHTNSIYKVYVGAYPEFSICSIGDPIIVYRTSDNLGPAYYRAVISSLCVIEDIRPLLSFPSFENFYMYCSQYSVLNTDELFNWYNKNFQTGYAVKMTYNLAFSKRITRKNLIDEKIIQENWRIGLKELSSVAFKRALELGGVNEGFVID